LAALIRLRKRLVFAHRQAATSTCSLAPGLSSAWRPLRSRTRPHKKPLPREVEKLLRFALAPLEHFHFHQTRACTRHHMLAEKTPLATDRLELRRLQLVASVGS